MAQQTAVQWLEEQLNKWSDGRFYLPPHLFEKAKEIEKQQIMKAYKDYHDLGHIYGLEKEQYYKETFTIIPQGETPSATRIGQS